MTTFNVPTIGTEIKPVPQTSLVDMLGIARGAQAYQQAQQINPLLLQQQQQTTRTGQIALSVEEQKDIERRNMQMFFADPNNFQTDGRIDLDKINKQVPSIAPLTGTEFINKASTLANAQTTADKATLELGQSDRELIAQPISILGRAGVTDPKAYAKVIKETIEQNKKNPRLVSLGNSYLTQLEFADPSKLPDIAIRASQNLLTPTQAQTALAPQPSTLNTGEQIFPTVTTPAVGAMLPRIQMGEKPLADVGIPPTQEVIDPVTGQKRLIGPASQRATTPIVTNLGPEQTSLLTAGGTTIANDWAKTVADAKEAPQRKAIFQNIKKLAPDAFTGPTAERRQMVSSFAQMLGMDINKLETSSTDELMKNTSLLQLAGGDTDAARELSKFANPNNKMTKEGIAKVADQLLGFETMKEARQNFLAPVQNDAVKYSQRMQQFNSVSDPRLFQEMSKEDVQKLFNSMSPAARTELTNKVKTAKSLGIIK
jgi:hypothetical protein